MFRQRVVAHFQEGGYKVHERVKVRGRSGTVHAVDLVAQGPLGNLVVSFGDEGGFEGPELSAVKRAAKDIGAAPVVAIEDPGQHLRRVATMQGIRILDAVGLDAPPAVTREETSPEALDHPWPQQTGRQRAQSPAAASLWKKTAPAPETTQKFAWLRPEEPARAKPTQTVTVQETEPSGLPRDAPARPVREHVLPPEARARQAPVPRTTPSASSTPAPRPVAPTPVRAATQKTPAQDWRWLLGPVVYGIVTGLVLFLFAALFL